MIVVDTSILSLAFRRPRRPEPESPAVALLRRLVAEDRPVGIPGIVVQEILSGLRHSSQFSRLRQALDGFPVLLAAEKDHVLGAEIANACRPGGVAATTVDWLIAAQTVASDAVLFSLDRDFERIARCSDLRLMKPVS